MRLPTIDGNTQSRDYVEQFRGYNHNARISDGEFFDETNLSSADYPVLSTRAMRAHLTREEPRVINGIATTVTTACTAQGITAKDSLWYVENYNGQLTLCEHGGDPVIKWVFMSYVDTTAHPPTEPRQLVSMGVYIVIMPDKLYYNTVDSTDKGRIGFVNSFESCYTADQLNTALANGGSPTNESLGQLYSIRFDLGEIIDGNFVGFLSAGQQNALTAVKKYPTSPTDGQRCIIENENGVIDGVYIYSSDTGQWAAVNTAIKINAPNILYNTNVKPGDSIKISLLLLHGIEDGTGGFTGFSEVPLSEEESNVEKNFPNVFESYHIVKQCDGSNLVIDGVFNATLKTYTGSYSSDTGVATGYKLTISNQMPTTDFLIESNNRLWGCRYGENSDGKFVNEIYASALGDLRNWNKFEGTAADSYTASCGTDGAFTGAISYLGYPMFFKENCLHKVYGNYPSNYQIQPVACRGVMKGAGDSLAIVGERLFYKSRSGVMVYDGSLPTEISSPLGTVSYNGTDRAFNNVSNAIPELCSGAVGGSDDRRYYISMKSDKTGEWNLFVYDTALGIWHREDSLRIRSFCWHKGTLYYIENDTSKIGFYGGDSEAITWSATTGDLGLGTPDKKRITRIVIRLALTIGASVSVSIQYDGIGQYQHITTMHGNSLQAIAVPVFPRRCDHFRIKLDGKGEVKLYSITKTIEEGSDR